VAVKLEPQIKPAQQFHFWPDASIFQVTVYNKEILEGRLRELAYLNKKDQYYPK
jgi:DNA gyrase/topoisomerase IV subunit B